MPIYEYKCECGKEKSIEQNMDDAHTAICECGQNMNQVYSNRSFKFLPTARWFDKKRAIFDANYARNAHFRSQELRTGRIR